MLFLIIATLIISTGLTAQTKVTNYSSGKPGTDKYEHFEFWTSNGKPTVVKYLYGKRPSEVKLVFLGKDKLNGYTCFKVRFPDGYVLYIAPKGRHLQITDAKGKYNKTFSWEYEGPVNGIGMYCDICAEDDEDAMNLIKANYLK